MRTKKVIRHYCDFCSKGSLRKPDMERHESQCFKNPERTCGLCSVRAGGDKYAELTAELRKRSGEGVPGSTNILDAAKEGVEWLRKEVDGCPACMLAVLQQADVMAFTDFDYKAERDEWYRAQREEERWLE